MIDPVFWNRKRVFITGHTGFKGGWLSVWLSSLGARVTGYALPPDTAPSFYELTGLRERVQSIIGDIRDLHTLQSAIRSSEPEVIFHLAAQPLVRRSYAQPVATFATNLMGTVNLLEAARRQESLRSLIIVTSDKCYENRGAPRGYRETDPMGGYDPYSASKGCAEIAAAAYRRSFFSSAGSPALATVRAGNVLGGGDWSQDRLIPDAIRALSEGRTLIVRNPGAVRPWQHVTDPLHGYLVLAERLFSRGMKFAGAWNFGPDESNWITVSQLASKVVDCWGAGRWEIAQSSQSEHEDEHLGLDSSKARTALGWSPSMTIEKAVEATVSWYRAVLSKQGLDAYTTTLTLLDDYQRLVSKPS